MEYVRLHLVVIWLVFTIIRIHAPKPHEYLTKRTYDYVTGDFLESFGSDLKEGGVKQAFSEAFTDRQSQFFMKHRWIFDDVCKDILKGNQRVLPHQKDACYMLLETGPTVIDVIHRFLYWLGGQVDDAYGSPHAALANLPDEFEIALIKWNTLVDVCKDVRKRQSVEESRLILGCKALKISENDPETAIDAPQESPSSFLDHFGSNLKEGGVKRAFSRAFEGSQFFMEHRWIFNDFCKDTLKGNQRVRPEAKSACYMLLETGPTVIDDIHKFLYWLGGQVGDAHGRPQASLANLPDEFQIALIKWNTLVAVCKDVRKRQSVEESRLILGCMALKISENDPETAKDAPKE